MGLSASQGRMLLLTARRSDLEFRAQQISQRRLILAQELEDISTDYENATSDRQMTITLYDTETDSDGKKTKVTRNLTYQTLMAGSYESNASGLTGERYGLSTNKPYRLMDANGYIVISDIKELGTDKGNPGDLRDASGALLSDFSGKSLGNYIGEKNDDGTIEVATLSEVKDPDGNLKYEVSIAYYVEDPGLKYGGTDANGETTGPNYLQDCIRNGKYLIQKGEADAENGGLKWSNLSWDSMTDVTDQYYTENDAAAEAKYKRLQNEIQNQDKKLELELDNIETQRSAVTTEVESVQKVMDDNIESTFKIFS